MLDELPVAILAPGFATTIPAAFFAQIDGVPEERPEDAFWRIVGRGAATATVTAKGNDSLSADGDRRVTAMLDLTEERQ